MGWARALPLEELPDRACRMAEAGGRRVLVSRSGARVYASAGQCPHLGLDLSIYGEVGDGTLRCRAHGYTMDLGDGRCLTEADARIPVYRTEIRDGWVWVCFE